MIHIQIGDSLGYFEMSQKYDRFYLTMSHCLSSGVIDDFILKFWKIRRNWKNP